MFSYFFTDRAGLCNPSLYFNFAKSSGSVVPDASGNGNKGLMEGGVRVNENYKCGRGAEFTNGQIKLNGILFNGMVIFKKKQPLKHCFVLSSINAV